MGHPVALPRLDARVTAPVADRTGGARRWRRDVKPVSATHRSSSAGGQQHLDRREVDAPARRVDALDLDDDRVPQPERVGRLRADEHRLELVELPPVAAEAPHGQEALEAPEGDEGTRTDDAGHLALELGVPAALEQLG